MALWVSTLLEEEEALFTYGYLGFLLFPPKLFDISRWNLTLENFSHPSYGRINAISIRLN
jgi:hypothetical protein